MRELLKITNNSCCETAGDGAKQQQLSTHHGAYTDAEHGNDMPATLCPAAVSVAALLLIMLLRMLYVW